MQTHGQCAVWHTRHLLTKQWVCVAMLCCSLPVPHRRHHQTDALSVCLFVLLRWYDVFGSHDKCAIYERNCLVLWYHSFHTHEYCVTFFFDFRFGVSVPFCRVFVNAIHSKSTHHRRQFHHGEKNHHTTQHNRHFYASSAPIVIDLLNNCDFMLAR